MNREEWSKQHEVCPKCGGSRLQVTTIGIPEVDGKYEDNMNTASCGCGWAGKRSECVPEGSVVKQETAVSMPIKTLDFNGDSYVNTKDVVVAMLDYNAKLAPKLPSTEAVTFADALFKEMTNMLVTVDTEHWINKNKYEEATARAEADRKKNEAGTASNPKTEA